MMLKLKIAVFCFLPLFANAITPVTPTCDYKLYIKTENGLLIPKKLGSPDYRNKPNKAPLFGIAIGTHIIKDLTMELALHHHAHSIKESIKDTHYSQKIASTSVFINANYDLANTENLVPYITLGIGMNHSNAGTYKAVGRINGIRPSHAKVYHAYNIGMGIKKRFNNNCELSLAYKYFNLGKATTSTIGIAGAAGTISTPVVAKLNNHAILIGATYHF